MLASLRLRRCPAALRALPDYGHVRKQVRRRASVQATKTGPCSRNIVLIRCHRLGFSSLVGGCGWGMLERKRPATADAAHSIGGCSGRLYRSELPSRERKAMQVCAREKTRKLYQIKRVFPLNPSYSSLRQRYKPNHDAAIPSTIPDNSGKGSLALPNTTQSANYYNIDSTILAFGQGFSTQSARGSKCPAHATLEGAQPADCQPSQPASQLSHPRAP